LTGAYGRRLCGLLKLRGVILRDFSPEGYCAHRHGPDSEHIRSAQDAPQAQHDAWLRRQFKAD
jgi:hypothetical protein